MARFKGHDLYLNDGDQIYFGDNTEAAMWFESGVLYLNSTISGTDPINDGDLVTKRYLNAEILAAASGVKLIQFSTSLGESSTTDTSWQEKLDINVSNIPSGNYKIAWSFEWSFSRTKDPGANFGVHVDWGTITVSETEMTPNQTYGKGAYYQSSGFGHISLDAGNHKVALNYCSGVNTSTTYIRRACLEIWRIINV